MRPHVGCWRAGDVVRRARELNMPPLAITAHAHPGRLPARRSLATLTTPELELTALKPADDGQGYIVRLADRHGRGGAGELVWQGQRWPVACAPHAVCTLRLTLTAQGWRATPCDLLERPLA